MGMDIWSESGFVIPFERFLRLFQPPHLLGVKAGRTAVPQQMVILRLGRILQVQG